MIKQIDAGASILVIEDNPTTSKTLVVFLRSEGYQVECAYNGRDGGLLFARNKFDLVLLDLLLPDVDDLSVCKAIRRDSGTPIVMLTAESTAAEIVEGLKSGADDYACKPFGSKELPARIRRCLVRSQRRANVVPIIRNGDKVARMRHSAT